MPFVRGRSSLRVSAFCSGCCGLSQSSVDLCTQIALWNLKICGAPLPTCPAWIKSITLFCVGILEWYLHAREPEYCEHSFNIFPWLLSSISSSGIIFSVWMLPFQPAKCGFMYVDFLANPAMSSYSWPTSLCSLSVQESVSSAAPHSPLVLPKSNPPL